MSTVPQALGKRMPSAETSADAGAGEAAAAKPADSDQKVQRPLEQHTQQPGKRGSNQEMQRLLLSQNHSCSFSNLPKGLQRLLSSHHSSKGRSSRRKLQERPQAAGVPSGSPAAAVPVFGDFDSTTMRCIAASKSSPQGQSSQSSKAQLQDSPAAALGSPAVAGEVFQSCISDSDSSTDSNSESDRSSAEGPASDGEEKDVSSDSADDEGVSLRSQLLMGYLLLLAAGSAEGQATAAAESERGLSSTAGSTREQRSAGSVITPDRLVPLANHLRQVGLLPKWVHWLLQQLPQRPELFQRAFNRLFEQVCMS